MPTKADYHVLVKQARDRIATGDFRGAQDLLETIASDPGNAAMGQETALGIPRKLHSAWLKLAKARKDDMARIAYQYYLVPPAALLAKHTRFTLSERAAIAQANRQAVPRTIHQIWIGPLPVPVATQAWSAHAAATGYSYRLWRENHLRDLGLYDNPVFADMLERGDYPGAVDVARYLLLEKEGGIYLDCDWYPARNDIAFQDIISMTGLCALPEDTPRDTGLGSLLLTNSFIAAPKEHPVLSRLLSVLPAVLGDLPDAPAWWSTGPLIFTLMCRGGSVEVSDASLVAGVLPRGKPFAAVRALIASMEASDTGFLIGWKPW